MKTELIRFNKKLYSFNSIQMAKATYQETFGKKYKFSVKEKSGYFEVKIAARNFPENFLYEFANRVISY
jgi:hypothetical protein